MSLYNTREILRSDYFSIKLDDILEKISEEDLYRHYIGNFKIGKVYNSPLRDDKNPSFAVFVDKKSGSLLYKDLATGQCGGIIKLVKEIKNLKTYKEALNEIVSDLNIWSISDKLKTKKIYTIKETKISISRKQFTSFDIDFWSKFGISIETLKKYNVFSISKFFVNGIEKGQYKKDEPIYAYKVFDKFKIYRPLSVKSEKWRGNLGSLDIQGYEQLPENGDMLIITKSLKDVMTLNEFGYHAVSPASETIDIPEVVINNLKGRFKHIIMFYDRDKAGISFTRRAVMKYNLDFRFINKKYKIKDISDFVLSSGKEKSELLLDTMFGIR